eukprot:7283986-Prymnesium_polylepis.1
MYALRAASIRNRKTSNERGENTSVSNPVLSTFCCANLGPPRLATSRPATASAPPRAPLELGARGVDVPGAAKRIGEVVEEDVDQHERAGCHGEEERLEFGRSQ